ADHHARCLAAERDSWWWPQDAASRSGPASSDTQPTSAGVPPSPQPLDASLGPLHMRRQGSCTKHMPWQTPVQPDTAGSTDEENAEDETTAPTADQLALLARLSGHSSSLPTFAAPQWTQKNEEVAINDKLEDGLGRDISASVAAFLSGADLWADEDDEDDFGHAADGVFGAEGADESVSRVSTTASCSSPTSGRLAAADLGSHALEQPHNTKEVLAFGKAQGRRHRGPVKRHQALQEALSPAT
ncbi:unnamed protein product, partial [Polarella glacialis]